MRLFDETDLSSGRAEALLHSPYAVREHLSGSRITAFSEAGEPTTLWLWVQQKRTCWYFKALHEYQAWVTTGEAPDSPQYAVEELALHISRAKDGANYWHAGQNASYWAKSDEIWHTGGACGRSACFAKATHWGGHSWTTDESVID